MFFGGVVECGDWILWSQLNEPSSSPWFTTTPSRGPLIGQCLCAKKIWDFGASNALLSNIFLYRTWRYSTHFHCFHICYSLNLCWIWFGSCQVTEWFCLHVSKMIKKIKLFWINFFEYSHIILIYDVIYKF